MLEVIRALSRNTIARENGLETSSDAMNHFCACMIQNGKKCSPDSYRNLLEWITCYSELDPKLKQLAQEEICEMDTSFSKIQTMETNHKVR